jgi:hypothetical protein
MAIEEITQWREDRHQHEVPEHPTGTHRAGSKGCRGRLQTLAAANSAEQCQGGSKGDQEAKAGVLCGAKDGAEALCGLGTLEVYEFVEEYLIGKEYGANHRNSNRQAESESGSRCRGGWDLSHARIVASE